MERICSKGLKQKTVVYRGDIGELSEFEGHGVALFNPGVEPGKQLSESGIIDFNLGRLVMKSNACILEVGDVIAHDPQICEEGVSNAE